MLPLDDSAAIEADFKVLHKKGSNQKKTHEDNLSYHSDHTVTAVTVTGGWATGFGGTNPQSSVGRKTFFYKDSDVQDRHVLQGCNLFSTQLTLLLQFIDFKSTETHCTGQGIITKPYLL